MGKCRCYKLKEICKLEICCLECKEKCNLKDKCLTKFRKTSGKHLSTQEIIKKCDFYIKK